MRRALAGVVVAATLLLGAAPAAPPDHPVALIKVDELRAHLDAGNAAAIIDVRTLEEFRELHIRGARSIPLRAMRARAVELPRQGLIVLY
jgi:3-mercaptopyruvate sulfurtransferase SseA